MLKAGHGSSASSASSVYPLAAACLLAAILVLPSAANAQTIFPAPRSLSGKAKPTPPKTVRKPAAKAAPVQKSPRNKPVPSEKPAAAEAPAAPAAKEPAGGVPAAKSVAPAGKAKSGSTAAVKGMRVEIPQDAWAPPTREAMFARGRLLLLEDYPLLGPQFRSLGGGEATVASPEMAPSGPEAAGAVSAVPMPRPKEGGPEVANPPPSAEGTEPDPDCVNLAPAGVIADFGEPVAETPAGCGIPHPIKVSAFQVGEGLVTLRPAAIMRCGVARALAAWAKEIAPLAKEKLGSEIAAVQNASSYVCRPRNHVQGAPLSEHGRANALDVASFELADKRSIVIGSSPNDNGFVQAARLAACKHLTTVLGPGTDPSHGNHLHVDLKLRKGGYRICQ